MFPVTRIYSDDNGDSHFEDIEIPLQDAGAIGKLSAPMPVGNIIFREVEEAYDYTFHTAPQKQYILLLNGGIEIETSLGEKRIFKPGEVLLVEDITGKGHRSKNLQQAKRRSVFITINP
jgi:hypothetical protein